jgi:hypothetical protein
MDARDANATLKYIYDLLKDHGYVGSWHLAIKTQVKGSGSTATFKVVRLEKQFRKVRIRTQVRGNESCWESNLSPPHGMLLEEIRQRLSRPPQPQNPPPQPPRVCAVPRSEKTEVVISGTETVEEAVENDLQGFTQDEDNVRLALFAISEKISDLKVPGKFAEVNVSLAVSAIKEACDLERFHSRHISGIMRCFRSRGYIRDGVEDKTVQITEVGRHFLGDRKQLVDSSSLGDLGKLSNFLDDVGARQQEISELEREHAAIQDEIRQMTENLAICHMREKELQEKLAKADRWYKANKDRIEAVQKIQSEMQKFL